MSPLKFNVSLQKSPSRRTDCHLEGWNHTGPRYLLYSGGGGRSLLDMELRNLSELFLIVKKRYRFFYKGSLNAHAINSDEIISGFRKFCTEHMVSKKEFKKWKEVFV